MFRIITMLILLSISFEAYPADIKSKLQAILDKNTNSPVITEVSSGSLDLSKDIYHLAFAVDKLKALWVYFVQEKCDGSIELKESLEVGGTNSRTSWYLEIKKKFVFISFDSSGGCCSHSGATYQLKMDNQKNLFIVGYEGLSQGSGEGELFYEDGVSVNLATGDILKTHAEAKKIKLWSESAYFQPVWRQFKLLPPISTRTTRLHAKVNKKWNLKNVSSYDDEFYTWLITNSSRRGNLN